MTDFYENDEFLRWESAISPVLPAPSILFPISAKKLDARSTEFIPLTSTPKISLLEANIAFNYFLKKKNLFKSVQDCAKAGNLALERMRKSEIILPNICYQILTVLKCLKCKHFYYSSKIMFYDRENDHEITNRKIEKGPILNFLEHQVEERLKNMRCSVHSWIRLLIV